MRDRGDPTHEVGGHSLPLAKPSGVGAWSRERRRLPDGQIPRRDEWRRLVRTIHVVVHPEATHHIERVVGGWHDSRLTHLVKAQRSPSHRRYAPRSRWTPMWSCSHRICNAPCRRRKSWPTCCASSQSLMHDCARSPTARLVESLKSGWKRDSTPPAVADRLEHDEGIRGAETTLAFAQRLRGDG